MRGSSLRICVPKTFCHPRVMSRSLPHLTLTTSTSSLSRTSPILQSSSSTRPSLLSHDPCIHTATIHGGVAVPRSPNLPHAILRMQSVQRHVQWQNQTRRCSCAAFALAGVFDGCLVLRIAPSCQQQRFVLVMETAQREKQGCARRRAQPWSFGHCVLEVTSSTQSVRVFSTGEAEFYALVIAAARAK